MSKKTVIAPSHAERNYWKYYIGFLFGSGFLYGILNPLYQTGFYNDDAIYVMVARDLWNKTVSHMYPTLHPDFPLPGLPLVLAPLAHLVDPHWTLLDWVTVAMTLLSVGLLGLWARKWMSAGESLAVMGLYAFNPIVARFSGIIVPSPYYTVAVLGSFLLMHSLLEAPTVGKALGLGFLLGWGSVIRPEGVVLLVSVMGPLVMVRRQKDFVRLMGIPLGLWGMFVWAWFWVRPIQGSEYGGDLSALLSYWTHHFPTGLKDAAVMLRYVLVDVLTTINITAGASAAWFGWFIALIVIYGIEKGFRSLWRQRIEARPELVSAGLFCGLYLLAHFFWKVNEQRYFIPLLPFALVFLLHGYQEKFSSGKDRKNWKVLGLMSLMVLYSFDNCYAIYETFHTPDPMNAPPWQSLSWLKAHTDPGARVLSIIGPNVSLYSHRPAVCSIGAERFESFRYRVRNQKLDYIVDRHVGTVTTDVRKATNPNSLWGRIRIWAELYPERFQVVYQDQDEKTTIYQYIPDPGFMRAFELYQLAAKAFDAGRLDDVYRLTGEALSLYPKLGSALNLRGAVQMRRGQLKDAEKDFIKAAQARPDSPTARMNLATLCFIQGHPEKAEEYIQQAQNSAEVGGQMPLFNRMLNRARPMWSRKSGIVFTDEPIFIPKAGKSG